MSQLPLRYTTPPGWIGLVMRDPIALLNDHAHLEKKAAANALELLCRRPDHLNSAFADQWAATMTSVARDEVEHLAMVSKLLTRRGGRLTNTHRNAYAAALRQLVRLGHGPEELFDRLLVSALIEVRSCERFELLAHQIDDRELSKLYQGLSRSERGHYLVLVELARQMMPAAVDAHWDHMLEAEAKIIAAQLPGPSMHSGVS